MVEQHRTQMTGKKPSATSRKYAKEKCAVKLKHTILALLLCACMLAGPGSRASKAGEIMEPVTVDTVTDYSRTNSWLSVDRSASLPVDVFYLYPTAWQKGAGDGNYCPADHPSMLRGAQGAFNRQASAFLPVGNIYAPYYRQADASYVLTLPTIEEQEDAIRVIPAVDGIAAFDYYLEHNNQGRPFILAGHSQGSNVLLYILSRIKDQPEVLDRMVAAYVIGFSVTRDYLAGNPPLRFASGPDDTGVIISFNTQAEGVEQNPVVRPGALAINPISWTLDETEAPKEDNLGSIMPLSALQSDLSPVENLASARIDAQKGTVICGSADVTRYSLPGWPQGVYHSFDYPFYFYNIRANAQNRVENYLAQRPSGK